MARNTFLLRAQLCWQRAIRLRSKTQWHTSLSLLAITDAEGRWGELTRSSHYVSALGVKLKNRGPMSLSVVISTLKHTSFDKVLCKKKYRDFLMLNTLEPILFSNGVSHLSLNRDYVTIYTKRELGTPRKTLMLFKVSVFLTEISLPWGVFRDAPLRKRQCPIP